MLAALLAFAVTRVWLLAWFEPKLNGDMLIYFRYAVDGVDLGHVPYLETDVEYPPLCWWTIAAPRLKPSQPIYRSYLAIGDGSLSDFYPEYFGRFRLMMAAFDLGSFALLLAIVARRRRELLAAAAWGYVLSTALLPHVLFDRLDIGLLFFIFAWAWCWIRAEGSSRAGGWKTAAYAALGLGISYKLIPLAIVPACLSADLRQAIAQRRWSSLLVGCATLAITALGPFVFYYLAAGPGVFKLFAYHGARGIEIESVWASLVIPFKWLGAELSVSHGHGSINLDSPVSSTLAVLSSMALAAILLGSGVMAWRSAARDYVSAGYRWGLLALLLAVVVAKVLSVQYWIFALPVLLALGVEGSIANQYRRLIVGAVVIAALSTLVYPYLFLLEIPWGDGRIPNPWPLAPSLHPIPCAALAVRNALFVASVLVIARRINRQD
jgi:hypothetical protein